MIKKRFLKVLLPLGVVAAAVSVTAFVLVNKPADTGKTAYGIWLSEGNTGTEAEFLSWVKSAVTQKLSDGAGQNASEQKNGKNTAYEAWLSEGNAGTETEFLAWIKQRSQTKETSRSTNPAPTTKPREETKPKEETKPAADDTAYNLWLSQGNHGSEAEFLSWIKTVSDRPSDPEKSPYDDVKFNSTVAIYDGTPHMVTATGIPQGTEVSYVNNIATDIGVHRAFVRLYRADLGEKLLTTTITINKAEITGVSFADVSFVYDGEVKKIKVSGAIPDGVEVVYTVGGNPFEGLKDAGAYEVKATLSGDNYATLTLSAILTIKKAEITGLTFDNQKFVYDDSTKNIKVKGNLPAGTNITYTDAGGDTFNGAILPGTYVVKATVTGANYQTKVLEATLIIDKATIYGITFKDHSTLYDGASKEIKISGALPNGVSVKYTLDSEGGTEFKGASAVGVYNVVATLSGDYYHKLVLGAKLVIAAGRLDTVTGVKLTEAPITAAFGNTTVILSWDSTANAGSYDVSLLHQDGSLATTIHIESGTSYDLKSGAWNILLRGDYNVEIVALPKKGDPNYAPSTPSKAVAYQHKGRLVAPKNVRIEGNYLKWDAAPDAEMYEIRAMMLGSDGQIAKSCSFNSDSVKNTSESMTDIKAFLKGSQCDMTSGKYRFSVKASTTSNGFWVGTYASDSSSPSAEYDLAFGQSLVMNLNRWLESLRKAVISI
jgi:hypothetical protein